MVFFIVTAVLLLSPIVFPRAILGGSGPLLSFRKAGVAKHDDLVEYFDSPPIAASIAPRRPAKQKADDVKRPPRVVPRPAKVAKRAGQWTDLMVENFDPDSDVLGLEVQGTKPVTITGVNESGKGLKVMLSNGTRLVLPGADRFPEGALKIIYRPA